MKAQLPHRNAATQDANPSQARAAPGRDLDTALWLEQLGRTSMTALELLFCGDYAEHQSPES